MKRINIRFASVPMLMLGMMLAAGCDKDKPEEPGTNPENQTGGIAWPERRVSHIDAPVFNYEYDFNWQNGKVAEILCTEHTPLDSLIQSITYSFTYSDDKIQQTHYAFWHSIYYASNVTADIHYEYSNNLITKAKVTSESISDENHAPFGEFSYQNGKLSHYTLKKWVRVNEEQWTQWEKPVNISWTDNNISTIMRANSWHKTSDETIVFEYDNHANPLYMPLGPMEALSLPLFEIYMFGIIPHEEELTPLAIKSNMAWCANNVTKVTINGRVEAEFRYDYDESGLYPTTMYLVLPDSTEQVFMTFTYEN